MHDKKIIRPEENCWRYVQADRASLLVDGENYFRTLHTAISQAQSAVYILAWDIDSRLRLVRGETHTDLPAELGELINAVLKQKPELNIYILNWDWAMLYTLERDGYPCFAPVGKSSPDYIISLMVSAHLVVLSTRKWLLSMIKSLSVVVLIRVNIAGTAVNMHRTISVVLIRIMSSIPLFMICR